MALLDALYIDTEHRNKGIANALIEQFKNWTAENNINQIDVNVCSQNIKAKNLYTKHNFITTKETMTYKKAFNRLLFYNILLFY